MSNTIPARAFVAITPSVISAGGTGLNLQGLVLSRSARVPVGTVQSFGSEIDVSDYFGASSGETSIASIYFNGFDTSNIKPSSVLYTQFTPTAVAAWLRGGDVSGLTLAELQALSGSLDVTVDGIARSAPTLDLSSATSFTAAATLIASGLNASPSTEASVTAAIAPATTVNITASIAGYIMDVTATDGLLVPGATVAGTGVTAGTKIANQLSGTTGGIGTYAVDTLQVVASEAMTADYGIMTVSAVVSGTLSIGQELSGTGVTTATKITALGTGTGLDGTYYVDPSQTAASTTITAAPVDVSVSYDSVSGGFQITSGVKGAASTVAYATGTLSTSLALTSATGALTSQGSDGQTPSTFMDNIYKKITSNWAAFMTMEDPDDGSGSTQKQLFAAWNSSNQLETAYVCWDTDVSPTSSSDATTSLGQILKGNGNNGTLLIWGTDNTKAAFALGFAPSLDYTEENGRARIAYKTQGGLTPDVTDQTTMDNLVANGYNCYVAVATAAQEFQYFWPGSVTGEFLWYDSYINEIQLNNALQLSILEGLTTVKSVPYNNFGYGLIDAWCMDPIVAALNFGSIRSGVPLSASQIADVNADAGVKIDGILATRGWVLQVKAASAQTRAARGSPPATLWYMDGQSVQTINLASKEVA